MTDWGTVFATVTVLAASLPLEYAILMWWLSRRLLSERNVTALSNKVAPVVEERLTKALPQLREGLRTEFLAGLKDPALRAALRAEVEATLEGAPEWIGKNGPRMAGVLGTVLDEWAASEKGQEALGGLLDGAVQRITPVVEQWFASPAGAAMVDKLAVRIRQEALRWWGSQKGGVARKKLREVVPKGTVITGIPAIDGKIGEWVSGFLGSKLEGMFGSLLGVQEAEFTEVPTGQPALTAGASPADGMSASERALLYGGD